MNISNFISGFFLLIGIVILLKFLGNRLAPVLMPEKRILSIGIGWLGGLTGSLLDNDIWQFGPQLAGINVNSSGYWLSPVYSSSGPFTFY